MWLGELKLCDGCPQGWKETGWYNQVPQVVPPIKMND
jgi:hypothetical protein